MQTYPAGYAVRPMPAPGRAPEYIIRQIGTIYHVRPVQPAVRNGNYVTLTVEEYEALRRGHEATTDARPRMAAGAAAPAPVGGPSSVSAAHTQAQVQVQPRTPTRSLPVVAPQPRTPIRFLNYSEVGYSVVSAASSRANLFL